MGHRRPGGTRRTRCAVRPVGAGLRARGPPGGPPAGPARGRGGSTAPDGRPLRRGVLLRGGPALPGPADDGQARAAVLRRLADRVEHLRPVLPGAPSRGLPLRAPDHPPARSTPPAMGPPRAAPAAAARPAGGAAGRPGARSRHRARAVAAAGAARGRGPALPAARDDRAVAAAVVLVVGSPAGGGPLLPLRREQRRQCRGPARLPVRDRADRGPGGADPVVVDRVRRVPAPCRDLWRAGRSGGAARSRRRTGAGRRPPRPNLPPRCRSGNG